METFRRSGYTLIEMIGAMAASSLLLVALASTVAISTSLVEPTDDDGRQRRDRVILDRMNQDLRFATSVDTTTEYRLAIKRPDLSNALQSLAYGAQYDGLTRQVDGGDPVLLDESTPTVGHYVDGYSAATSSAETRRPRIRDVSTAVTDGSTASWINIAVPDGARTGDLLLLITVYRNAIFVFPSTSGWNIQNLNGNINVGLIVRWQMMTSATPRTHSLFFSSGGDVAVAMLAVEHPDLSWPFGWSGSQIGTSSVGDNSTFPQPVENATTIGDRTLNLQIFASTGTPLPARSMRIASMVDCVNLVASPGTSGDCSLGIAFRTGPMPSMSTIPRARHRESANWITIGTEVEGASE